MCIFHGSSNVLLRLVPHVEYLISKMLSDIRIITSVTQLVSDMRSTCTCISYYIICKSALIRVQLLDLEFGVHQLRVQIVIVI